MIARRPHISRGAARHAFTLIDLLVSLAVMAIVLVVVVPAARNDSALKVVAASTVLASDIEYAQSLTLASPSDPAVVRLADDGASYWLALASAPDTPITRAFGDEPYEMVFGEGRASSLEGVTLSAAGLTDDTLTFDAFGRIASGEQATITVTFDSDAMQVVVSPRTGSVSIENAEASEPEGEPPPAGAGAGAAGAESLGVDPKHKVN